MGETLGLRRYLKTVSNQQLRLICQNNPEYFHEMAPYALALGADKRFAKQFGKLSIGQCPYIFTGADNEMRAKDWVALMHRVLSGMNTKTQNGYQERLIALLEGFLRQKL
jgi:hypothetical protein